MGSYFIFYFWLLPHFCFFVRTSAKSLWKVSLFMKQTPFLRLASFSGCIGRNPTALCFQSLGSSPLNIHATWKDSEANQGLTF